MVLPLHRLVVLGTGFGAFNLVKYLRSEYDITVISPRNHLLFTPLLPSTTVGTIEFRSIIEPIRHARKDLRRSYPHLVKHARITVVEASREIPGTFDEKLRRYATDLFRRQRISVLTDSPVVRVKETGIVLKNGNELPYGLLLWSTGNDPTGFVQSADLPRNVHSRIIVDRLFRVKGLDTVYAIGDCCIIEGAALSATAQVAQQEGKYLARALGKRARGLPVEPLSYRHLGMLAYVGGNKALADLEVYKGRGWTTWLFWRSTYLTRIVSMKNKASVLFDWIKAQVFGRDISQF